MVKKETRAGRYGRALASWINHTIETIPEAERSDYRRKVMERLSTFAVVPRKRGEANGNKSELIEIGEINVRNGEDLARTILEGVHLMYQEKTAGKVMNAVLEKLNEVKLGDETG
jgi:hypothetical protein